MIHTLPGHGRRRFVSVIGAEVGVGQEQEQVAEIEHAAAHQVGKYGFNLGNRRGTGGDQIFVPLLVAGTGNQRDAVGAADFHQRLEYVAQRAPAAQQAKHHHRGSAYRLQQLFTSGGGGLALTLQRHRIAGVHAHRIAPWHPDQRALGGQDVGIGGGHQHDGGGICVGLGSHGQS